MTLEFMWSQSLWSQSFWSQAWLRRCLLAVGGGTLVLAAAGCGAADASRADSEPSLSITASAAATSEADFDAWLNELATDGDSVNENAGSGETGTNDGAVDCAAWLGADARKKTDMAKNLVQQAQADGVTGNQAWAENWLNQNCS